MPDAFDPDHPDLPDPEAFPPHFDEAVARAQAKEVAVQAARRRAEARQLGKVMAEELHARATELAVDMHAQIARAVLAMVDGDLSPSTTTCTAIVISTGLQCMSPAKPGSDRCGRHTRSFRPQFQRPNGQEIR